ncbi:GMC family oxidoreductase [Paraherbaspirillum soli]|uniref:GMC family oxidoreductase n=1 Tax=Paraherbaspirillum soli TaxID=631222 RepID=A0ABW0M487_9BURK
MDHDASVGPKIDELERAALSGKIGRRDFLARLLALGVSATSAGLLANHAEAANRNQRARRAALRDEYDYIIVGAGSAGCVLASRISATGASVLLVEAGGADIEQPKISDVKRWPENIFSDTDWGRTSVPRPGLGNRPQPASGGKIWGGSGSINAMIWLRGDVRDFRHWEQHVGPEWNLAALQRAYLRLATPLPSARPLRSPSGTGPITFGRYAPAHPLTAAYIAAGSELGLGEIEVNAGGALDGIGIAEVNATPDGRRSGPAQAYLIPALTRPNLTVLSNTLVTSLVLEGDDCRGINAIIDGVSTRITAARETILCAGTFESPKLLMLSGIGSADQLGAVDIQVRHEMPGVGRNLQDHILLKNILFKSQVALPPPLMNAAAALAYFSNRSRLWAPDVEIMCLQSPFLTNALPLGSGFSIAPFLSKPRSRGCAKLVSADPRKPLSIDPRYLQETIDQDNLIMALDRSIDIGNSNALKGFSAGLYPSPAPKTRSEKLAFIAQNGGAGFHYVGTCSAGRSPANSVVNSRFRVWGVDGLMVVDGSVIPEVTAVNTQVPILTLAELAAEQLGMVGE